MGKENLINCIPGIAGIGSSAPCDPIDGQGWMDGSQVYHLQGSILSLKVRNEECFLLNGTRGMSLFKAFIRTPL